MKLDLGNPKVSLGTNILDIKVPKELRTIISTGDKVIDALYTGTGVRPSTVSLVTGGAGAGKTTMMLGLADSITGAGHIAYYNTGEESLFQVGLTIERMKLKNGFIPGSHTSVPELIKDLEKLKAMHKGKQLFVFLDSLQCLEMPKAAGKRGRALGPQNMAVAVLEEMTKWAKANFAIIFVLGHVKKDGEFEGKNKVKHIIDCHLELWLDNNKKSDTFGLRIAEMSKNRFGVSGTEYPFQLVGTGVRWEQPVVKLDESDMDSDEDSN